MGSSQDVYQGMEGGTMERIPVRRSDEIADDIRREEQCTEYNKDEAQRRKQRPLFTGCVAYFPRALMEVAHCSWLGQQQHNPGKPLAWDRSKSSDDVDAWLRHRAEGGSILAKDSDGAYLFSKVIWRELAEFEKALEKEQ